MENITEIFFKKIIPEALQGTVNCEIPVRIVFNVYFKEQEKYLKSPNETPNLIIPTLIINDVKLLDELLSKYVETMLDYYQNYKFSTIDPIYYSSFLISTAIANMGAKDYLNPELYFQNKIKAIKNNKLELSSNPQPLGYSDIFDSELYYVLDKEKPNEEAPIKYTLYLKKGEDLFKMQTIRFYVLENIAYIGAIQGTNEPQKSTYQKKINRILYKANESITEDNPLYKTNPGSIVALTSLMTILKNNNITNLSISPYGIQRWNDKKILYSNLEKALLENDIKGETKQKVVKTIERTTSYFDKAQVIRSQLINSLLRIHYHFDNVELTYDGDTPAVNCENISIGNNTLLNEIFEKVLAEAHKKTNL